MFSSWDQMLPYPLQSSTVDRAWKPNVELAPNCPRCDSSNTKFCYYNNYSLTQPRYFCKGCRRYWTKGGSLRNVPVGGGCRKNRRGKSVRLSSTQRSKAPSSLRPDLALDGMAVGNSMSTHSASSSDGSDIDLAMLYAKFLNQCPEFDLQHLPGETGEFVESMGGGSSSSNHQMTYGLVSVNDSYMKRQRTSEPIAEALLTSVGELQFSVEPSGYDQSLSFPAEGANDFSSNCPILPEWTWQTPKHQGFGSMFEDNISSHQNLIVGDWSSFEPSTLEASCRP